MKLLVERHNTKQDKMNQLVEFHWYIYKKYLKRNLSYQRLNWKFKERSRKQKGSGVVIEETAATTVHGRSEGYYGTVSTTTTSNESTANAAAGTLPPANNGKSCTMNSIYLPGTVTFSHLAVKK